PTPCTWNTLLARSIPIVLTFVMDGSFLVIRLHDHLMAPRRRWRVPSTASSRRRSQAKRRAGTGRDPDSSPLAFGCERARRCKPGRGRTTRMRYREKNPCVYILASWRYGTLVTSDLFQRVALRNQYLIEGFTKKI